MLVNLKGYRGILYWLVGSEPPDPVVDPVVEPVVELVVELAVELPEEVVPVEAEAPVVPEEVAVVVEVLDVTVVPAVQSSQWYSGIPYTMKEFQYARNVSLKYPG